MIQDELQARVVVDGAAAPVEDIPLSGYLTSSRFADENEETLAAFQRALKAAAEIAGKDPSAVREILPTYTKVTEGQAEQIDLLSLSAHRGRRADLPAHRPDEETGDAEEADRPGDPRGEVKRRQELGLGLLGVLLAFGVCEAVSRAGIVRRSYLPPASEVLSRALELAGDSVFLDGIGATLRAWVLGLGLACAIAVPLGLLLGSVPLVDAAVRAIVEFLRPLPSVALIPLVSLLLGSGTETKVALITYACVWPILFNTIYGLGETDPLAKDTLRAFGFGRLAVLLRVELPGTAPFIAAGIRISAAVALILAVATEILAGFGEGLGIFIAQASLSTDGTRDVLAGVVWAGALGLVINGVLVWGERRLFPWTPEQRERAAAYRGRGV